jgi:hypothetical protein
LGDIEQGSAGSFPGWKKHKLTGYRALRTALVKEVNANAAILDDELTVTDHMGRTIFADLIKRRHLARYFAPTCCG